MSRQWWLFFDRLIVAMCAIFAAWNFDSGNHFWLAFWTAFTVLAIIDYAWDTTRTWATKKAAK